MYVWTCDCFEGGGAGALVMGGGVAALVAAVVGAVIVIVIIHWGEFTRCECWGARSLGEWILHSSALRIHIFLALDSSTP